jgi:proteasome lid subunit RPN8/RPN11
LLCRLLCGLQSRVSGRLFTPSSRAASSFSWAFRLEGAQWVGDWHTHPLGGACPSETDLKGYRSALANDDTLSRFLTIIIVPHLTNACSEPVLSPWWIEQDGRPEQLIEHDLTP